MKILTQEEFDRAKHDEAFATICDSHAALLARVRELEANEVELYKNFDTFTAELIVKRDRIAALEAGLLTCRTALLPNDVIESIREEWGNTNVAVYKHNSDAAREEIKKLLSPFPNTGETAA